MIQLPGKLRLAFSAVAGLLLVSAFAQAQNSNCSAAQGSSANYINTVSSAPKADEPAMSGVQKNVSAAKHIPKTKVLVGTAQQKSNDAYLIRELNRVPGVDLKRQDLQTRYPTWVDEDIKGVHPIKKMLQPIMHLEKNSQQLQKQIMRLEGPIAGLQPAMLGLHRRMTSVENRMGHMQSQLGSLQDQVIGVNSQMTAVRQDLKTMQRQIGDLEGPIEQIRQPLAGVAGPLTQVKQELGDVKSLIAIVLLAIVIAAIAIAIGTPVAAVLIYRNRRKIFPNMREQDFPVVV